LDEIGDFSDGSKNCDLSGTKAISGTPLLTMHDIAGGNVSGSFTITYSTDCQETPIMETTDGDCAATTTLSGTATVSFLTWDYSSTDYSYDPYYSEMEVYTDLEPLSVTVGSSTSEQNYLFTHTMTYSDQNLALDGTVEFEDTWFDMEEVASAVNDSTQAIACP
jgi:hypothetical protein